MKTLSIFAALVAAVIISPLAAQKGATHVSSFEGHCELTLPNVPTGPCNSGVLWLVMQNGRSIVTFTFTDDRKRQTTFPLAGGKDRQPNPENYYLSVDTLRTNFYNTKELVADTEGECHFSLNEPGTRYYFIRCLIYNRRQGITFNFTLNDIQTFETKAF
jgi:hypothetical protein